MVPLEECSLLFVTEEGTIVSKRQKKPKTLKTYANQEGFQSFRTQINKKQMTFRVHVLVARAYLGPRPEGHLINHKDGNKANNKSNNLEYVPKTELNRKGYTKKRKHHLTVQEKEEIRSLKGKMTRELLAHRFRVSISTIYKINKDI